MLLYNQCRKRRKTLKIYDAYLLRKLVYTMLCIYILLKTWMYTVIIAITALPKFLPPTHVMYPIRGDFVLRRPIQPAQIFLRSTRRVIRAILRKMTSIMRVLLQGHFKKSHAQSITAVLKMYYECLCVCAQCTFFELTK